MGKSNPNAGNHAYLLPIHRVDTSRIIHRMVASDAKLTADCTQVLKNGYIHN